MAMNNVDGQCACCGDSTPYTGRLPIICPTCVEARKEIAGGGAQLLSGNNLNPRLFLPDAALMPQPKTLADFR